VQGFVKNLDDGRVQLVAEGSGQELDSFLTAIADRMGRNIHDFTVNREPATGEFSTFEIVH
jgi:acylphosphatase